MEREIAMYLADVADACRVMCDHLRLGPEHHSEEVRWAYVTFKEVRDEMRRYVAEHDAADPV